MSTSLDTVCSDQTAAFNAAQQSDLGVIGGGIVRVMRKISREPVLLTHLSMWCNAGRPARPRARIDDVEEFAAPRGKRNDEEYQRSCMIGSVLELSTAWHQDEPSRTQRNDSISPFVSAPNLSRAGEDKVTFVQLGKFMCWRHPTRWATGMGEVTAPGPEDVANFRSSAW